MRYGLLGSVAILSLALALPAAPQSGNRDVPPNACPLEGTAKSATGQTLNRLKNRQRAPRSDQIDPNVTLEAMLAPGNDMGRFNEQKGAVITGWVVRVQQGGHPGTANCVLMSLQYTDTHITVGLTPDAPETETLVVEVTPRWREMMANQHVDWSTEALQQKLVGKRVQFTGWLMFDTDHLHQSVNLEPGNSKDWRKTVWEIHPITGLAIQ
jgi:hypothetical protein